MNPPVAQFSRPARVAATAPQRLRWPRAVALHVLPGVALVAFFLVAAPFLSDAGLPPVWGLLLGTLLVMAPIEVALVVLSPHAEGIAGLRRSLGVDRMRRNDVVPVLFATTVSTFAPGLVVWLEPVVRAALFAWLPGWFGAGVPQLSAYPPAVAAATVVLWLVSQVVVGPAVEELYFRGWLLTGLPGGGTTVVLTNAALFSVYHLWEPYAAPTIFLFALPLAVLVRKRHNVVLSIVVHSSVNLLTFAALVTGALNR